MNGLRIGITIGLREAAESLWSNGIKQNAIFLAEALRHCQRVASVVLVNTTNVPVTTELPWDLVRWPTLTFEDARHQVDIVIELGGQLDAAQTEYLKQRGVRLVSYCCGSEYILVAEAVLFGKPLWDGNLFVNQRYDDIWMIPQVAGNSQSYFEVLRHCPARVVPFVWSPIFLEQRTRELPHAGVFQPSGKPWRLAVMEPNINIVKTCLYPVFIAELVYRQRPEAVELLQVTNAIQPAEHNVDFIALMNQLDIVREHKAVFLGRYDTPAFLAQNTDIVISHQLENPLNYFYLEVCWQGYPLVHNASLCPDLGYYYHGNDASEGACRVLEAMDAHCTRADDYLERQRKLIERYLPHDPKIVATYDACLAELMSRTIR